MTDKKMNAVEKLLAYDKGVLETPTGEITLKLKKLKGLEVTFPIQAIDPEMSSELNESIIQMDTTSKNMIMNGTFHLKVMTIVYGCPSVFQSQTLKDKFGVTQGKDLVKKLLVDGEMQELKDAIDKLSGFESESDNIEEVKN